jgi:hypothetical protein
MLLSALFQAMIKAKGEPMSITRRLGLAALSISIVAVAASLAWAGGVLPYPPSMADDSPAPPVIDAPDVTLTVTTTPLCPYNRKLDGQWFGSGIGSDGKVYFGSSCHGKDAAGMFFQYDPRSKNISVVIPDFSVACHEDAKTMVPQGKIHTPLVEHDGWLYFATHLAAYYEDALNRYTGAHVLAYKIGSLEAGKPEVRDFGVIQDNYSCYAAISVDPIHGYLYVAVTKWWKGPAQGYLYRYKLDGTGKTMIKDFGSQGGQSYFQFVDERGDLWFTDSGSYGTLFKMNGETGKVTTYPNALPKRKNLLENTDNPQLGGVWGRAFGWGEKLDGNRCVFSMLQEGGLWEFDASKVVGNNAAGAFRFLHWIGTHSGIALGGDTVYYLQSANPKWDKSQMANDLHLKSVKLDPAATIKDWGRVVDQDGRTPYRADGMCADAKGNVYITGDWRLLPNEIGSDLSSLTYDPKTDNYYIMWRGQFFCTVTVPPPAPVTPAAPAAPAAASAPAATTAPVLTGGAAGPR